MNVFGKMSYAIQRLNRVFGIRTRKKNKKIEKKITTNRLPKKAIATIFSTQETNHNSNKMGKERKKTNANKYELIIGLGHSVVKDIKLPDVNVNYVRYKLHFNKYYVRAMCSQMMFTIISLQFHFLF